MASPYMVRKPVRKQYIERKYHSKVWFMTKPNTKGLPFNACWCNSCTNGHYSNNLLRIYFYKGINIKNGQIITQQLVNKVSETFYKYFHKPPKIPSLKNLSGQTVTQLINKRKIDLNEIPFLLKRMIIQKEFKEHTMEYRRYFNFKHLTLPKLLSEHIGQFIVIGSTHPNKFRELTEIRRQQNKKNL